MAEHDDIELHCALSEGTSDVGIILWFWGNYAVIANCTYIDNENASFIDNFSIIGCPVSNRTHQIALITMEMMNSAEILWKCANYPPEDEGTTMNYKYSTP